MQLNIVIHTYTEETSAEHISPNDLWPFFVMSTYNKKEQHLLLFNEMPKCNKLHAEYYVRICLKMLKTDKWLQLIKS